MCYTSSNVVHLPNPTSRSGFDLTSNFFREGTIIESESELVEWIVVNRYRSYSTTFMSSLRIYCSQTSVTTRQTPISTDLKDLVKHVVSGRQQTANVYC